MKNIVLLGGSNSVKVNGLQKGLREYANVTNLALGSSACLQNLYELKREKNQYAIKNADLIVTESNINEIYNNGNTKEALSLEIIFKNLQYLYATLYELKKPVCILILPLRLHRYVTIDNMHRFLANYYGLNIIDMQSYYQNNEITKFGDKFDAHQLDVVNRYIGKEIAKNIDRFSTSSKNLDTNLAKFKILTPENMQKNGSFKVFNAKNLMYDEIVYRLEGDNYLSFEGYKGYHIIGIHGWNLESNGELSKLAFATTLTHCAAICIDCNDTNVVKKLAKINHYCEIQAEPIINGKLIAMFNKNNLPDTEFYHAAFQDRPTSISLPYFDLIAFFLCKPNPNTKLFDLSVILTDKDIEIDRDIDRSYLIPNIVFFKDSMEFIDEYIGYLYPNITKHIDKVLTPQIINKIKEYLPILQPPKTTPQPLQEPSLQDQINSLKEQISKKDNEIKALQTSYEKAANFKNHLSYKLGNALIKAHKSWYKGGYIKFIFEAIKIKNKHKWQN